MVAKKKAATAALWSVSQLTAEIRRYCRAHPNARDSMEGIAWWLAMQHYNEVKRSLNGTVDRLVARGVLTKDRLTDGTYVFGCNTQGCTPTSAKRAANKPRSGK